MHFVLQPDIYGCGRVVVHLPTNTDVLASIKAVIRSGIHLLQGQEKASGSTGKFFFICAGRADLLDRLSGFRQWCRW